MGKQDVYEFTILRNHPESKRYEIMGRKGGLLEMLAEKLGLKR